MPTIILKNDCPAAILSLYLGRSVIDCPQHSCGYVYFISLVADVFNIIIFSNRAVVY